MDASFSRIHCGNIATLSTDRVVVGRPQRVVLVPQIWSEFDFKCLKNNNLIEMSHVRGRVAEGLLSSGRLSQRSSERS